MKITIHGTQVVDVAKLWKRGNMYQIAIVRDEIIELLREYDNREVLATVAGVPFRGRLKYEVPKRGHPYIRIFLPKKLNAIWSKLHEITNKVKVEVIIENESTTGGKA